MKFTRNNTDKKILTIQFTKILKDSIYTNKLYTISPTMDKDIVKSSI